MKAPWGEWAPDRGPIGLAGLRTALNVRPDVSHYEPMPGVEEISSALTARCQGIISARDISGDVHTFAGDATKLYELNGSSWDDVSKVGGYSTQETDKWRYSVFGDRVIATNFTDNPQYFDMTSSTDFADLAGSPPKARHVMAYGDFVVLGNTSVSNKRLDWSGINNSEIWTPGTSQSDYQEFPDGGYITGLGAADAGYVFQEYCIRRMLYVGGGVIMQFDTVERERGCVEASSLTQLGRVFFYLSEDGFYMFDGQSSQGIGQGKIDSTFKADADRFYYNRMSAAVDPINKLVGWLYVSNSASSSVPDSLLVYHWPTGRWAKATYDMELLSSTLSPGYTLEDLDALYASLDAMTISLDDPVWSGGNLSWGGMSANHKLASFSGSSLEATIETDDFEISEGLIAFVDSMRPLIDGDAYCKIGSRMRPQDTVAYSTETITNVTGNCPQRSLGRYSRARMRVPAATSWTKTQGFELNWTQAGMR